ncbi:hypothetical protein SAMN05444008_11560 [Cnuella takakiae]|uniref:Uncharacterized protein n=1 Tax=Cnuella takakiae TaxID=1302690 RepID=A0A1M5G1M0_9BACT|nr:hypothetical protein [Cnuella takakiae]OLY92294.1 hypothetical protein BUE76_10610 [Cnuella takakiae]SHF97534.1 hypothetical protein SAMN05444008_11560 [Cnuella takakiae]
MSDHLQPKTVSIYIDDAPGIEAYNRLSKKQDDYNTKIAEGSKRAEQLAKDLKKALDSGKSGDAIQKKLDSVNKTLDKNREALAKVTSQQQALAQQLDSKSGPSLKSQAALVQRLYNEYQRLGTNTKEAEQKLLEYANQARVLDQMREKVASVRKVQQDSTAAGSSWLSSFAGNLAAGAVMKVGSLVEGFFSDAVTGAMEAEAGVARFQSTMANLGREDAFDRLSAKADEMAEKFKYLDNDDVLAVFDKLVTYGKLTEKQMNDLMPVIIDFAAKQRITLEESASVVIKALEGNGKALKDYGIDIKDAETTTERFNVVMTDLASKVEGAGEAFQNTAAGGVAEARQQFDNLKEDIGTQLIPVLATLLGWLNKIITGLGYMKDKATNTFSDVKALLTGGVSGLLANRGNREVERQAGFEAQASSQFIQSFDGKGQEEISKALIELQQNLQAKQKLATSKYTPKDQVIAAQQAVRVLKLEIDGLLKLQDSLSNTETLGINAGGTGKTKKEKDKKDPKVEQAKKDAEELEKYLKQKAFDLSQFDATEQEKELDRAYKTWEEKKLLAHGNQAQLKHLEELYWQEITQIQTKYGRLQTAEFEKKQQERIKRMEDLSKSAMAGGMAQLRGVSEAISNGLAKADRRKLDAAELKVIQTSGREQLQAKLDLLKEEERQELAQAGLTEERKLIIEEQYRQSRKQAEFDYYASIAESYFAYAQQVLTLATMFDQLMSAREDQQLAKEQRANDRRKSGYRTLLNNKLVSQQEYNRRIAQMDADLDARKAEIEKKQFERQKKINIAQAIANGAMAVTKILAETPKFDFGVATAIQIGLAAATTATQVALITKQKPQFRDGGQLLDGPSHEQGGVPLFSRSGAYYGEAEGGEVILSRKTVRNNPDLVGALLYSSMNRSGAPIVPAFRTRTYQSIDYGGLSRSIQRSRYYANGGTLPTQPAAQPGNGGTGQVVAAMPAEVVDLLRDIRTYLGIPPKAYMVLSEAQAVQDQYNQLKSDSTFRKQ